MLISRQSYIPRICSHPFVTTSSTWKQPKHDRLRMRRHLPPPRHQFPFVHEAPVNILPEKPPVIPASWDSTVDKVKNLRFNHGDHLSSIPTTFEKLEELYHLEKNLWFHSLDLPLKSPEMLDFSKFITRTKLLDWSWELPSNHQSALGNRLAHQLSEQLLYLYRNPVNIYDQRPKSFNARKMRRIMLISSCMETAYQTIMSTQPASPFARGIHQIDEFARVETFLKRLYPREMWSSVSEVDEDLFDDVDETVLDDEGCVRYRIRADLAWQLRGPDPLQPFLSMDHPVCYDTKPSECLYRPEALDLKPVDCFKFSCLPKTHFRFASEFARSVAGYWSRNPFYEGDPCEFGLLGVLDARSAEQMWIDVSRLALSETSRSDIWIRSTLAEGLLTAFSWASAQAYNQGFTLYNELTYPFTTQILLFDHDHIQLLRYQLNSLVSLWQVEDCSTPYNLVWFSPKVKLFEFVDSLPCGVRVFPEAVSLLVASFLHPTDSDRSTKLLRPYLASGVMAPRDYAKCSVDGARSIPRLIPDTADMPDLNDSTPTETRSIKDLAHFTEGERKALEAARRSAQKLPLWMRTPGLPHPNEVFFYKLANQRELLDELSSEVPSLDGSLLGIPEKHEIIKASYRRLQRNRQARSRVEAPPRRWR
ncbi:28S ribosomal protein S30 mitochondrial [Fasciolopsis buskii]|uniref:28S ribosomal protein S30 mitochondrial n=1 Tax=Fasciolopsis buskii TaxID=27845 RepID=A0A8E0VD70_9TREM|nr:28S ribosomal protein S30 mitochondrial [Fasciolopsis buski]